MRWRPTSVPKPKKPPAASRSSSASCSHWDCISRSGIRFPGTIHFPKVLQNARRDPPDSVPSQRDRPPSERLNAEKAGPDAAITPRGPDSVVDVDQLSLLIKPELQAAGELDLVSEGF